jgi:hypothetical protein
MGNVPDPDIIRRGHHGMRPVVTGNPGVRKQVDELPDDLESCLNSLNL